MARVSKTYAPSDMFDGSSLGRPLRDEAMFTNGRDWSISRDSLINGRPASVVPLARRYDKRKKRRCCKVTKMEIFLMSLCAFLLLAAIGIIIAWSIVSKGFRFADSDEKNAKDTCVVSSATTTNSTNSANSLICTSAACAKLAVNFLENLNTAADPCEDFYEFACGGFVKHHDIPNDKPYYNVISGVDQKLYKRLKNLLQSPVLPSDDVPVRQAKTLYQACERDNLDPNADATPMTKILESLGGWPVLDTNWTYSNKNGHNYSWERATVELLKEHGKNVLLEISVVLDPVNTTHHIIQLDQVHLGLENRVYYLNGTENYLLKAYYVLMVESAVLLGANRTVAERDMLDVVHLEIELAKISSSEDSRREPNRLYNRFTKLELKNKFPKIDFQTLIDSIYGQHNVTDDDSVVVVEVEFFEELNDIMERTKQRTIYNYLLWRLVGDYSNLLPAKFREPLYNFRSVNFGTSARTARWEECVALTRAVLPMIVGSIYVREYFKEESREAVHEVCETLKSAFIEELKHLDWMDSVTKSHAEAKAKNLKYHIGYPDWIYNSSKLLEPLEGITFTMDNLLESVARVRNRKFHMNVARLPQLMDPEFWFESPALVDAYYVPPRNEMVFPAGIIQFPFFLAGGPTFVTFATVGTVVGHEIVHGFDDEGRHYDERGNLHNWWDKETEKKFQRKTDCLAKQYGSVLVPEVNKTLNGRLTLGENIADNVALPTAFNAFDIWTKKHGQEPKLPGFSNFTNQQMFFIAYANNWCSVTRPEYYEYSIFNDPHSPSKYRTIVPLKNFPPFSDAFKCSKTSVMNAQNRCKIW